MSQIHIHEDDVPWGDYSASYPAEMMRHMRAKRLIGPGGAIESEEVLMGTLEIDPGASYPPHRHAAPELYFVLEGAAECRFGDEVFVARKGSMIRTPPGEVHAFRNLGAEKFVALGMWWAPGGDRDALLAPLELVT